MRAGGHLAEHDPDKTHVVPWALPEGDKSWIQLATAKDDDDEEKLENNKEGQMKFISGTLYAIARDMEKKNAGKSITMTTFGKLIPTGTPGSHSYGFTWPAGHAKHKPKEYIPNTKGGKKSSGNVFQSMATREGILGPAITAWRMKWDPIGHNLLVKKPMVVTRQKLELKQGKPVKIAWIVA
jgi:hypothetical protein